MSLCGEESLISPPRSRVYPLRSLQATFERRAVTGDERSRGCGRPGKLLFPADERQSELPKEHSKGYSKPSPAMYLTPRRGVSRIHFFYTSLGLGTRYRWWLRTHGYEILCRASHVCRAYNTLAIQVVSIETIDNRLCRTSRGSGCTFPTPGSIHHHICALFPTQTLWIATSPQNLLKPLLMHTSSESSIVTASMNPTNERRAGGSLHSFVALSRYVVGEDLYVPPRNASELDYILKRYTTDVLHSLVSQARDSELRTALPKARQIAASSLSTVLQNSELLESLLIRHSPPENDVVALPASSASIDSPIPSRRIPTA
ncbi:hypothetical protein AG1IA_00136 [Rhizoctonia solani AG-1 IA]|uniref:Uncharacterized protein n=1 Tax=Thanatephorus cucumeris (strain AG1-IA) TaxID=983506 RepID=L8XAZ3_THACA|nr:hypothetical protein AG1IA_00136 [Rhizoctonia solani AG-1 IA]